MGSEAPVVSTAKSSYVSHQRSKNTKPHAIAEYAKNRAKNARPAEWAQMENKNEFVSSYNASFSQRQKLPPIPYEAQSHGYIQDSHSQDYRSGQESPSYDIDELEGEAEQDWNKYRIKKVPLDGKMSKTSQTKHVDIVTGLESEWTSPNRSFAGRISAAKLDAARNSNERGYNIISGQFERRT
ncbi:hypothetical protein BKA69DRAFT_1125229 [Paraphysoderma sedebokerense]|nr:hypothetical protein BKA69DRAFT_1125229 [Paraphysoderma sedebokerense]